MADKRNNPSNYAMGVLSEARMEGLRVQGNGRGRRRRPSQEGHQRGARPGADEIHHALCEETLVRYHSICAAHAPDFVSRQSIGVAHTTVRGVMANSDCIERGLIRPLMAIFSGTGV